MSFIHENFLLSNDQAVSLYYEYAKDEPILDFHNHLPPDEIANNRRFENLAEAWLEADHYKWRAMRANGTPEELVTGNGDPKEKYLAWAATIPNTLGNPLSLDASGTEKMLWNRYFAKPEYGRRNLGGGQ